MSEGSNVSPNIVIVTQTKEKSQKEMFKIINQLPFKSRIDEKNNNIVMTSYQIQSYVEQFGHAKDKFIPDFIKKLSLELINIFLDAYILGDGMIRDRNKKRVWTASPKMADDLQELFIKIGSRASVSHRTRLYNFSHGASGISTSYCVRELIRKSSWIRKRNIYKKHYKGKVYCVSVPNSLILVRRNGFVTICGNSISMIAGCSSGIEPLFDIKLKKNLEDTIGENFEIVHPLFSEERREYFVTALMLTPEEHIKIQAAFQKYTDNAVSKTINLPSFATVEDVDRSYRLAYESGCKGVALYRNGSRSHQIISMDE